MSVWWGDPRRRGLVVVVVVVVAAGGGTLFGARYVRSPAQVAADAAPPVTGPVTAVVEHRAVRTTVVLRGEVGSEQSFAVSAPSVAGAAKPVVTRLPGEVGREVVAGDVVGEVSGRPVIVLPGAAPAYRDITPGTRGGDVKILQGGLRSRGYRISDLEGLYGPSTKTAITALYRDAGYTPLPTVEGEAQQLTQAQRRIRDLRQAHATAPPEGRDAARQAVTDAEQDLADLESRSGPKVSLGEIAFVPVLPARVASRPARMGSEVGGELLTLAGGGLVVRARLESRDARLVRAGQPVEITSEQRGRTVDGTVVSVQDAADIGDDATAGLGGDGRQALPAPGGDGRSDTRPELVVHATSPLSPDFAGENVRLTVVSASTDHEVLVVPLSAVTARTDGRAVVIRVTDGREEQVVVTAGVSGGGYVEVSAAAGGLAQGDRVVIGR
ncbi:hypothetical protein [Alloactinosynnema sp. L-07]|uniref:hypothetical protein n=1 Tax=Alloactinosynnema sp. L-07 TaxID=1653480 RepID=UPI000A94B848|nr:hypothetical protein [Alloactinosynnema sp. L-07]